MEPWRVCRAVVADSHNFDEEQDQDPHHKLKVGSRSSALKWKRDPNPDT
jgi:hypothetical protein